MYRSPFLSAATLVSVLQGLACANMQTPEPAAPTPPQERVPTQAKPKTQMIQMCVAGATFQINAEYLAVKVAGKPDVVFRRLNYACDDDGQGVEFHGLGNAERTSAETCEEFRVPNSPLPWTLYMGSGTDADPRPVIYTQRRLEEVIAEVFAKNPCGYGFTDDGSTVMLD